MEDQAVPNEARFRIIDSFCSFWKAHTIVFLCTAELIPKVGRSIAYLRGPQARMVCCQSVLLAATNGQD